MSVFFFTVNFGSWSGKHSVKISLSENFLFQCILAVIICSTTEVQMCTSVEFGLVRAFVWHGNLQQEVTSWGKGWRLVNKEGRCLLCAVNLWNDKWALLYLTLLHVDFTLRNCMQIKSEMPQSCLCTNSLVLFSPSVQEIIWMEHFIMSKLFLFYVRSFEVRKELKQKLMAGLLFQLFLPLWLSSSSLLNS